MKKITIIGALLLSLIGCNDIKSIITEEQAKSIAIEQHTKGIGEVEIISITTESNKYIIEWENKENCENGKDSVNKNSEIKMIEASIC